MTASDRNSSSNPLKTHFLRLFAHLRWADLRALESIDGQSADSEVLGLMSHVLGADLIWLTRLKGEDSTGLEVWPTRTIAECRSLADQVHEGLMALLDGLPDDLGGEVHYRNGQGAEFTTSVRDILTHVATHGAYHRGQIAKLLRISGDEPVNTDFITFAREDQP